MSYVRFLAMIVTSTVLMFLLMYANTYVFEHIFYSETRVYMAIAMGACMAFVMLAFMLAMYPDRTVNVAIFCAAVLVFALSLWLVRSQATVSGPSYMRAMIPHHSIAIMTSERAGIVDPRVRKLADEIIAAQRREISEMRYLISETTSGRRVERIYTDPPPEPGTAADALANTLVSRLDLDPMPRSDADRILPQGSRCMFNSGKETDPILWIADGDAGAAVLLNGVLIAMQGRGDPRSDWVEFTAPGATVAVRSLGGDGDWRQDAELVFGLEEGLATGYRGFYSCEED